MDQRGRKGDKVVPLPGCDIPAEAPGALAEPPEHLTDAEKAVWRAVVASKPADWFGPENLPLLTDYCTACVQADEARAALSKWKNPANRKRLAVAKQFDSLVKLKMSLATKMRLTQQSRYDKTGAHTASKQARSRRPWDAATGTSSG